MKLLNYHLKINLLGCEVFPRVGLLLSVAEIRKISQRQIDQFHVKMKFADQAF
jgi:hypothetical protein